MSCVVLGSDSFIGRHIVKQMHATPVSHKELDLLDAQAVHDYFTKHTFDVVIHCAVVGGSRLKNDDWSVLDKNLRMFFNVMNVTQCKVIYFSSGAALRHFPHPPTDPYGFSKYVIEQCSSPRLYILRIWGCFGQGEPSTRFLATAKREGRVTIQTDQEFDFFHVNDVVRVVEYIKDHPPSGILNMVYPGRKYRLSEIADMAGVSKTIESTSETGYTGEYNLTFMELPTLKNRIQEYLDESV